MSSSRLSAWVAGAGAAAPPCLSANFVTNEKTHVRVTLREAPVIEESGKIAGLALSVDVTIGEWREFIRQANGTLPNG